MITWLTSLITRLGWRRLATWAAAVVALVALEAVLHDPFGWRRAKLEHLQERATSAEADARARTLEADAERQSTVRVARLAGSQNRIRAATEVLVRDAVAAPDADEALDPARLARLRAHDAALCAEVALTGCEGVTR